MTQAKDLLRPLGPAQRLGEADRETLDAIWTTLGDCSTLITTQGEALLKSADSQLEAMEAFAETVGLLAERIDAAHNHDAAHQAELTEALQQVPAALTGFVTRLEKSQRESTDDMRAGLSTLSETLEKVSNTLASHDRRLADVTESMSTLSAAVATLREETRGRRAREAQPGRTRMLDDLVRGTTVLAARIGFFEATLARYRSNFWLHAVALPLLIGCAFFFGMMADFMIRFLDGSAATAVPLVTDLLPWPPPDAAPETVTGE